MSIESFVDKRMTALRRMVIGGAVVVSLVVGGAMVLTPKERALELGKLRPKAFPEACIDGVAYLTSMGIPSTASVGQDGLAKPCQGEGLGLAQFDRRFTRSCAGGVEVVKMYAHKTASVFIRYDASTRMPMGC
jgi:hypothetical protein